MMKLLFKGSFIALALFIFVKPAKAQVVTENITLDFGRFVIVDNSAVRRLRIRNNCTANPDPEFMIISPPRCGNYTVSGYPPFTPLTIALANSSLNNGPTPFNLRNLRTIPNNVTTDALGEATFEVRAQLRSDGSGGSYIDGTYIGNFTMTITP